MLGTSANCNCDSAISRCLVGFWRKYNKFVCISNTVLLNSRQYFFLYYYQTRSTGDMKKIK